MGIAVRPAAVGDVPWLLEQLAHFDQFFGSSRSLFPDEVYATETLTKLIETQPFFVAVDARGPVGFIAGLLSPHFLNPSIQTLSELFWWVAPEARGSRAGFLLLSAFIACGKEHADWIIMTLEAESPVDPSSLIRRGFRVKETSYLLEVAEWPR